MSKKHDLNDIVKKIAISKIINFLYRISRLNFYIYCKNNLTKD